MSVGPLAGIIGSAAGTHLAQIRGSEPEQVQDTAKQDRHVQAELKSETAAGIGATDGEDQEASERDADGRRLWEAPLAKKPPSPNEAPPPPDRQSRDATGQSGNALDLCG